MRILAFYVVFRYIQDVFSWKMFPAGIMIQYLSGFEKCNLSRNKGNNFEKALPGNRTAAAPTGSMRHSDKSSLDKPHFWVCNEAAAGALSEPPSTRILMLFLMARTLGFSKKNFPLESMPPLIPNSTQLLKHVNYPA